MKNGTGKYFVGGVREMIRQRGEEKTDYRKIWIKGIPFKTNFFLLETM